MRARRPLLAGLAATLAVAGACGDGDAPAARGGAPPAPPSQAAAGGRRMQAAAWDTVFTISGGVQDTVLLIPRLMAARGGLLYVFDYGDSRLKAFDAQGRPRWRFGREGSGPEEFGNPLDLEVGPEGSVWVLDGAEGRMSVVSAQGRGERLVRHPGLLVRDVVPLRDRLLATSASPGDTFWIALDTAGRVREAGPAPFPELRAAAPVVRQGYATVADDARTWASIFPFGSPFVVYDGTSVRCQGRLVEGQPLPAERPADPRNAAWAVAAVLTDSSLFVLPRGRTELRLAVLDEYSARDCRYLRTIRLPQKIVALAYSGGVFYFGVENPAPSILAARLRPR